MDISSSVAKVFRFCSDVFTSCWGFLSSVVIFRFSWGNYTLAHFLLGIFIVGLVICAFSIAQRVSINGEKV